MGYKPLIMKPIIRKIGMLIALLWASISAFAYDFELPAGNGMQKLQYDILSSVDQTVAVVGGTTGRIPCSVTYNNKKYTVTEIGRFAFSDADITDYRLPLSLKVIRENAFGFSKASTIAIPDGVEVIETGAFWHSLVETIIIGSGVKKIEHGAFEGCSNLKTLVFRPQKAPNHESMGYSIGNSNTSVIVPQLSGYEGSEIARVIAGTMIEPIHFKQNQFEYSGITPTLDYVLKIKTASTQRDMNLKNKDVGTYEQAFYIGLSEVIPSYSFSDFDGYQVFPDRGVDVLYKYSITKKPLFVKIINHQRMYGEPNPSAFTYSIDGFVDGEDENQLLSPIKCETTASIQSPVGSYPITCNPSALNYSFEIQPGLLNIQKAPIDIAIQNSSRTYGDENPIYQYNFIGLRCGDTDPEITSALEFTNINKSSDCGEYSISILSGELRNYYINNIQSGTLSIIPAPLLLKVQNAEKMYYEKNPEFKFLLEGLRNNDTHNCISSQPSFTCTASLTSQCGEYEITASNAHAHNYEISYESGILTITQAPLTLVASDIAREYGEVNPVFKYSAIGLKGEDSLEASLELQPRLTTTATENSSVGEYPIFISEGSAKNYKLAYRAGVLTINKAPLTVVAENVERMYGDSNPAFTRSYFGFKLNDTESSAFSSLPKLSCAATKTSDAGTYPITVTGGTSRNYDIVAYENGTLTITKAPLVLSVNDKSRLYYEDNPTFDFSLTGLRNGDVLSCLSVIPKYECQANKSSVVGNYTVVPFGAESKNYSIEYRNGTLSILPRQLQASVGNYSKVYGTDNPQFEVVYKGFVNNENKSVLTSQVIANCSAERNSDVGTYPIILTDGDAVNYVISKYNNGELSIEKADQALIWKQDLSNIPQYSQIALEATSSAGLPITYEMSPNNVATLYDNGGMWYLDCYGSGTVNIRALQNGDMNHNAAAMLTKTLVVFGSGEKPSNPQIYLNVEKAGTLPTLIAEKRKYQIKNLCLSGYLNGTDINFLREMAGSDSYGKATPGVLETLDISKCTIVSGGRSYYNSYRTSDYKVSDYMFYNCKVLTNLILPDNSNTIDDCAFSDCERLSVIAIPNDVVSFGQQAFSGCISLLRIPMPNQLTSIGAMAFSGCNGITEISIPASVSYLGDGIVKNCQNIERINVESRNTNFASKDGVLYTSALDELLIYPVAHDGEIYQVLESASRIAPFAFVNAKKLKHLTLPEIMSSIGEDAFIGCVNLSTLQVRAITPPVCDNDCFENVSKTRCELQVPQGCYSYYWVAPVWSDFNKIVETPFTGMTELESEQTKLRIDGSTIIINGVNRGHYIRIFQTDGTLLYHCISDGNDVRYQASGNGVYIVVLDNQSHKIAIK